jgi:hypothetical protein
MSESLNINESLLTCTALLTCHPTTANPAVQEITVRIGWGYDGALVLTYMLTGDCNHLRIPDVRPQAQIDGLWQHTCFEVFVAPKDSPAYWEFNFSPSSEWAVYQFRGYRDRAAVEEVAAPPMIAARTTAERLELNVRLFLPHVFTMPPLRLGLSTVVEDNHGRLSYWALRHPSGKPDFHHPDTFALEIVPPRKEITEKESQ